jgi:hypothetical protein
LSSEEIAMARKKRSGAAPTKKKARAPHIALHLPPQLQDLYVYCLAVWAKMKADTLHFPTPYPPASEVDADLTALHEALKAAEGGGSSEATSLEIAGEKVRADFAVLGKYADRVLRALSVEEGRTVIANLLLHESKVGHRSPKAELKADAGPTSGLVLLKALAVLHAVSYYWELSVDRTNWSEGARSAQAHAQIAGLTPGKLYHFRFRCLLRDGTMTDPSHVFEFIVR